MKQFIKDNTPYYQTDREDLVNHYLSIGCEEVSILYDGTFLKPFWDGTNFIEGATPEEIASLNEKAIELDQQNKNNLQFLELQPTDWYFTRLQETGKLVPLEILEQRANIRAKYL